MGVHAGGAWGDLDVTSLILNDGGVPAHTQPLLDAVNAINNVSVGAKGGVLGAQAGFNVQSGSFVLGGVLDFGSMSLRGSRDLVRLNPIAGVTSIAVRDEVETNWLLTIRPRVGVVHDRMLLYATGGLAVTELKYAHAYTAITATTSTEQASVTEVRAGWTLGGGVEFAIDGHWTMNAEYLFADFGSVDTPRARVQNSAAGPLNTVFDHNVELSTQILRAGINYRF